VSINLDKMFAHYGSDAERFRVGCVRGHGVLPPNVQITPNAYIPGVSLSLHMSPEDARKLIEHMRQAVRFAAEPYVEDEVQS